MTWKKLQRTSLQREWRQPCIVRNAQQLFFSILETEDIAADELSALVVCFMKNFVEQLTMLSQWHGVV